MDSFRSYGEHLKINLRQLGFTTLSPTPNFPLVRHLPKTAISAERTLQPLRLHFDNADDDDIFIFVGKCTAAANVCYFFAET